MSAEPAQPGSDSPAPGGLRPYFASEDGRFLLYQGDCLDLMPRFPAESFDMIFADPPYFLSNGGITCHAGRPILPPDSVLTES